MIVNDDNDEETELTYGERLVSTNTRRDMSKHLDYYYDYPVPNGWKQVRIGKPKHGEYVIHSANGEPHTEENIEIFSDVMRIIEKLDQWVWPCL